MRKQKGLQKSRQTGTYSQAGRDINRAGRYISRQVETIRAGKYINRKSKNIKRPSRDRGRQVETEAGR